jgi:hypothetical protein
MAPRYRVLSKAFFQPNLVEPGSIIEWDGPVGYFLEPLNEEAEEKMDEYKRTHPTHLGPIDQLPSTGSVPGPAVLIAHPPKDEPTINSPGISRPELAPTDGGKILEDLKPKKAQKVAEEEKPFDPEDPTPASILVEAPRKKTI